MRTTAVRPLLLLAAILAATLAPLLAHAERCSTASAAGNWAYTYAGTILTPSGALPAASVGRFKADESGNFSGTQTRSVAGSSGGETITGTISVNPDCTGYSTVNVYEDGQLQRTAVLAIVYDDNMKHARAIFQSLTLANGANVPVVITIDLARQFPKD